MRRCLHGGDQSFAGNLAFETAEIFRRDDHDFVPAMDGHVLRTFGADAPNKLAETRFRIL
jgi:hypothetical protein